MIFVQFTHNRIYCDIADCLKFVKSRWENIVKVFAPRNLRNQVLIQAACYMIEKHMLSDQIMTHYRTSIN